MKAQTDAVKGIRIDSPKAHLELAGLNFLLERLQFFDLMNLIERHIKKTDDKTVYAYKLKDSCIPESYFKDHDTESLYTVLIPPPELKHHQIEAEILIALLASPVQIIFPSHAELEASIRIRITMAEVSEKVDIDFHTSKLNRPKSHWTFFEGTGFCLQENASLTEGLHLALLPPDPTSKYSFSCHRATEYIILLAIATESKRSNPALYDRLEKKWRDKPCSGEKFQNSFLREIGSTAEPLPRLWLIPGDRVWFKNPDEKSSNVLGYEGSWVIYLGQGKFSNFWNPKKPYTLTSKLIELFCWRFALEEDLNGQFVINESRVTALSESIGCNAHLTMRIIERMMSYRDPHMVYGDGGSMDSTREHIKYVTQPFCEIDV